MTSKLTISPLKMATIAVGFIALPFVLAYLVSYASGCSQNRHDERVARQLRLEIARLRAEAAKPPDPLPVHYGFELKPGESRVIETNGQPFDYRFYGTTRFHLYRGTHAKQTITFRRGSYEHALSGQPGSTRGVHTEVQKIELERPAEAKTPLGYNVVVYQQPTT